MLPLPRLVLLAFLASLAVNAQDNTINTPLDASGTITGSDASPAITTTSPPAPTGTTAVSPCILGCAGPAATENGCKSISDIACICSSATFQADTAACVAEQCPTEIATAAALRQHLCGDPSSADAASTSTRLNPDSSSTGTGTGVGAPAQSSASANAAGRTRIAVGSLGLGLAVGALVL